MEGRRQQQLIIVRLLVDGGLTPALLNHRYCSRLLLRLMVRERLRRERLETVRLTLEQAQGLRDVTTSQEARRQLESWIAELFDRLAAISLDLPEPKPQDKRQLGDEAKSLWEKSFALLDAPETVLRIDQAVAALMARRQQGHGGLS